MKRSIQNVSVIAGTLGLLALITFMFFSRVEIYYPLNIEEPSGLSYSENRQSLYLASDEGVLYQITLTGEIIKQLPYQSKSFDFEGVTVNPNNGNIYVVNEGAGELIELDSHGVLKNKYIASEHLDKFGLEGVTYDIKRNIFYMLNEMQPGILIKYSLQNGVHKQIKLNFATDYSGIYFNERTDKLWIVSRKDNSLFKCNLSGTPEKRYYLFGLHGAEGLVVNSSETTAYIVSDTEDTLYKINLENNSRIKIRNIEIGQVLF